MDTSFLYQKSPWVNPAFDLQTLFEYRYQKRDAFTQLQQVVTGSNLMVHIRGLRRLGKSTLMKQMVIDLIERQGINRELINFVEFSATNNNLEFVLHHAPHHGYLFLDEIQHCPHWRDSLKLYFDDNDPMHARIIFTGSATMSYTQSKESLLGRFLPVDVQPLSFPEYLFLKYGTHNPLRYNETELISYLHYGEFPGLLAITDDQIKQQYLTQSILEPLFTTDVALYAVDKKAQFSLVFKLLCANMGQVMNKQSLASDVGISRPIVDKYLQIMEDMGLIQLIPNYYKSINQSSGSAKKVYSVSLNLALVHLGISNLEQIPLIGFKGSVFENFVFNQLSRQYDEIFYWKRQNKELDFVCHNHEQALAIHAFEVKSRAIMNSSERQMYSRYATEAYKGSPVGTTMVFTPVLWNFRPEESGLLQLVAATDRERVDERAVYQNTPLFPHSNV